MKFAIALSPLKTKFGPLFFSGNLSEGIEKAAEYGYDGIEISVKDPALLDKEQIRSQVQRHSLDVVTLATGQSFIEEGPGLCSSEQTDLSKTVKRLCDIVDLQAGKKLIEIGLDVLHSLQPLAMDPVGIKKKYGSRLMLFGGMDIQQLLPFGTRDEILSTAKTSSMSAAKAEAISMLRRTIYRQIQASRILKRFIKPLA